MTGEAEKFGALTIDTQTIQQQGFQFDRGLLGLLRQFKNKPLQIVISQVIIEETHRHLEKAIREARDGLVRGLRDGRRFLPSGITVPNEADVVAIDPNSAARDRFDAFLTDVGGLSVSVEYADMKEVMARYNLVAPPFAQAKDKKHEFPDAIALLSLEGWAAAHDQGVLAVSQDNGWLAFGEQSKRVTVVPSITDALSLLQSDPEHAEGFVEALLERVESKADDLAVYFKGELTEALNRLEFDGEGESSMDFEITDVEVKLLNYHLEAGETGFEFTLVQVEPDRATAELSVEFEVEASAYASFSVYDSVDKDEVPMGSAEPSQRFTLDGVKVLICFEGDLAGGQASIESLEIVDLPNTLDFGFLEPEWRREEED